MAGCNDDDACTDDTCDPDLGCSHVPFTGFEAILCRCDQPLPVACLTEILPENIETGRARACDLIAQAGADAHRSRRLLLRAARVVKHLQRKAKRAGDQTLSPTCSAALQEEFRTLRELARDYARSLPRP